MKYNGYTARVEYDDADRIFVGHLAGIEDIVGFHGATVDELEASFHESVDNYLAISEETGRPAQKPYSGNMLIRMGSGLHKAVAITAEVHGESINQWTTKVLRAAVEATSSVTNPGPDRIQEVGNTYFSGRTKPEGEHSPD